MNYNPLEQKLIAICGLVIFLLSGLQAQDPSRPNTIFGKALFLDHYSPQEGALSSFENFSNGFEIGYLRNISPNFNAVIPLKVGVIKLPGETDNRRYVGVDFVGQLQYYTEESRIIPYGLLGLGAVSEDFGTLNFQVPIGAGVNIRLGKYAFINLQGEYRAAFVDDRSNLQYGLGIAFMLGDLDEVSPPPLEFPLTDTDQDGIDDSKDECPEIAGLAILGGCPDTDGDGLSDSKDECPEKYGSKETNGCPDSDGDGIVDSKDDCPNVKGEARFNGCPDTDGDGFADIEDECPNIKGTLRGCPDSDGDGIVDSKDDCPNVKGEARFNGCPDTDGDGIPDIRDKCPNSPAPNSPIGCPEIKQEDKAVLDYALQAVQFETGVDVLKEDSKLVLDQVIDVLKRYPDFRLEIIGHTDNVGSEINNLKLSQRRAKACYDYLLSKGISANVMNSGGFGESNPIVSNDTLEGRSLNRRVEFILAPR
jgi:OmpA-OmpF porin, OOP family